jgi:hypothetical protein
MEAAQLKADRWIMTTAPTEFDLKPYALDRGPQFLLDGVPLRKVAIGSHKAQAQMEMYHSEHDDDGESVFFAMLDKQFSDMIVNSPAFKASIQHIVGEQITLDETGDTTMANRKNINKNHAPAPKAPVVAPKAPEARPLAAEKKPATSSAAALQAAVAQRNAQKAKTAQEMAEDKAFAESIAQKEPAEAVLIRTPHTPSVPAAEDKAAQRAEAMQRLVNVEERTKGLYDAITKNQIFGRITELEATQAVIGDSVHQLVQRVDADNMLSEVVTTQQTVIDTLVHTIADMSTRLSDLENAVTAYLVGDVPAAAAPVKEQDVFDVLGYAETPSVAPQAPRVPVVTPQVKAVRAPVPQAAPKVQRSIPAKGTGVAAQFSDEDCETMAEMYDDGAGLSMKEIARQFDIRDANGGFNSKMVWHLIHRVKA